MIDDLHPYVAYSYSPVVHGRAKRYSGYVGHRVVRAGRRKSDGEWSTAPNCHAVRVIADDRGLYTGVTAKSVGVRSWRAMQNLATHRNLIHQVERGNRRVSLADIAEQANAELQRELIEHYDGSASGIEARPRGWDTWLADVQARQIDADDTGTLVEIASAAEPIRAVCVTCPTTGRQYALRVPPATKTARAAVAWTFGLTAEQYRPAAQS